MSKNGKLASDSVTLWMSVTNYGVKFHKTPYFNMSRHPCTIVLIIVYTNVIMLVY